MSRETFEKSPYDIETGRGLLGTGLARWAADKTGGFISPPNAPAFPSYEIPESWTNTQMFADLASEVTGKNIDTVFEALWYPHYESETERFAQWVNERVADTFVNAEEIQFSANFTDAAFGGTSITNIGSYYKEWIRYAVQYSINDALTQDPPMGEIEVLSRLQGVYLSIRQQAESEVNARLTKLGENIYWYRGFVRPYAVNIAFNVVFFAVFTQMLRAIQLYVKMGFGALHNYLPREAAFALAPYIEQASELLSKFKLIIRPDILAGKLIDAAKLFVTSGKALAMAGAAATATGSGLVSLSGWLLGVPAATIFALVLLALTVVSIRVDAPEVSDVQWDAWLEDPQASGIQDEVRVAAQQIDALKARIDTLGDEVTAPGNAFKAVLNNQQFAMFTEEKDAIWAAIDDLTITATGPGPLADAKVQLYRALEEVVPAPVEATAAEVVEEVSRDEVQAFMNPLELMEILMPVVESMSGGRTNIPDAELSELFEAAAYRKSAELDEYAKVVAARILSTRRVAVAAPSVDVAVYAAIEGLEYIEALAAAESMDIAAYRTVLQQLLGAKNGAPSEMLSKINEGIDLCQKMIEVLRDVS